MGILQSFDLSPPTIPATLSRAPLEDTMVLYLPPNDN